MPGSGTHITVVQRLAASDPKFAALLGDPTDTTDDQSVLKCRYANLGAIGPDFFYAMLDYGSQAQDFENFFAKAAGTIQCVSDLMEQVDGAIQGAIANVTLSLVNDIDSVFKLIVGVIKKGFLAALVDAGATVWPFLEPARQKDVPRHGWFWGDYLHYIRTGCFAQKLIDLSKRTDDPLLVAYAYGYLTHVVTDTIGHSYVNLIVQSPFRNYWQRHHLVENFIDTYVWDRWHTSAVTTVPPGGLPKPPLDTLVATPNSTGTGSPLNFARLNDFTNIGGLGFDDGFDAVITKICQTIENGVFDMNSREDLSLTAPEDPHFTAWAKVMVEALWTTYPMTLPLTAPQDHPTNLTKGFTPRPGGYPTIDDIAAAYGVFRFLMKISTDDWVGPLTPPDLSGDLGTVASLVWAAIESSFNSAGPPPSASSSGGHFNLSAALDALVQYARWLGRLALAVGEALVAVILGAIAAGGVVAADTIKYGLYLLSTLLFAVYRSFRDILVLGAFAVPFPNELLGGIGLVPAASLWVPTMVSGTMNVPLEEVPTERDFFWNPFHGPSPYRAFVPPSSLTQFVEQPPVPPAPVSLMMQLPDDFLDPPVGPDDMFSVHGPATAATVSAPSPAGPIIQVQTFISDRDFGGAIANCARGIRLSEAGWPTGAFIPDYNLDADRGYAWPSWDVQNGTRLDPLDPPNAGWTVVDAGLVAPAAPSCAYDAINLLLKPRGEADAPANEEDWPKALLTGDVLLYFGTHELIFEPFTYAIVADETTEIGGLCPYSHASVVIQHPDGSHWIAEAQDIYRQNTLYSSIEVCDRVDVYRFEGITEAQRMSVSDEAQRFSSATVYATIEIALLGTAASVHPPAWSLRDMADKVDQATGSGSLTKQMICSEMVARVFEASGLPLTLTPWPTLLSAGVLNTRDRVLTYTTPNMLSRAPELRRLFSLSAWVPVASS